MSTLSGARIRHSVAFTLRHPEGSAEEATFLDAVRALAAIPGVEAFELVDQISPKSPHRYGFSMEFADRAAHAAYDAHPDHRAFVAERWGNAVADFVEVDFAVQAVPA
jgi:quinol monooxygenase YgiN